MVLQDVIQSGDGFKGNTSPKHDFISALWINVIAIDGTDGSSTEQIIDYTAVRISSSRACWDYSALIGALFEWSGLKLELVCSGSRPLLTTM